MACEEETFACRSILPEGLPANPDPAQRGPAAVRGREPRRDQDRPPEPHAGQDPRRDAVRAPARDAGPLRRARCPPSCAPTACAMRSCMSNDSTRTSTTCWRAAWTGHRHGRARGDHALHAGRLLERAHRHSGACGGRRAQRLHVCWAAQAALFASHGIEKRALPAKAFGVFEQRVVRPDIDLMSGLGLGFPVPVSRHTTVDATDIAGGEGLTLLADCPETGPGLVESRDGRDVYSFNHFEYDPAALGDEYRRDLLNGLNIARPKQYFRDGDPSRGRISAGARRPGASSATGWSVSRALHGRRGRRAFSPRAPCPAARDAARYPRFPAAFRRKFKRLGPRRGVTTHQPHGAPNP